MTVVEGVSRTYHAHGATALLFRYLQGKEEPPEETMVVGPAGTGKSLGVGKFLWSFLDRWPGCKVLVLRKTRVSLNDSWLDTFENEVLWPEHPAVIGKRREYRTKYAHPNGGELRLGGFDQPRRLFSTQYHVIYVNEMTELSEAEWMSLHRALRAPGGPGWHLLIGDANPDAEFHWANRRFPDPALFGKRRLRVEGRERILSFHRDNPAITKKYLHRLDTQLVGHMRERLFLGRWCTASGLIYPAWSKQLHLQSGRLRWRRDAFGKPLRDEPVSLELRDLGCEVDLTWFGASMDFGFRTPGCLQVWGHDPEGRGYRVAEVYQAGRDLEWWGEWAAQLWDTFRMRYIVCDSALPESIKRLNDHLHGKGIPRIAVPVEKPKRKLTMFNVVREAMKPRDGDGFPSLILLRNVLRGGRDPAADGASMPCCTEEEIGALIVRKPRETERGEVPFEESDSACQDHGCDAMGYEWLHNWGKDLSRRAPTVKTSWELVDESLKEDAYQLARREKRERRKRA